MVQRVAFQVSARYKDQVSKAASASLRAVGKAGKTNFKQVANQIKRTNKTLKEFSKNARRAAKEINAALGGRIGNAAGKANNIGQNISSISNRLGFMAFQWNFMANAASRAVDVVVGGLSRIITEGAQLGDSLTRALAFSTEAQDIRGRTDKAFRDIVASRDAIFAQGSGQSIFGIDQISNVARELNKAFQDPLDTVNVLPFVAQLKTLEPQLSDEKIGSGLVSLFAVLGTNTKDVNEIAAAFDFLSNVIDRSTANFQSGIASLGVAATTAKSIGITAFETGVIIQQVSDVLARNVGGGRASATAGRYANAFFATLGKIADKNTKGGKFAREIGLGIFEKDDKGIAEFKDLVGVVEGFRETFKGLNKAQKAARFSQLGIGENDRKVLLALQEKTGEELRKQIELLKERGVLEARAKATATSAQSQILRIKAAIDSLKITISDGFAPALKEMADQMSSIAGERGFRVLMADIGKIFSNNLVPAIKQAFRFIKIFLGFLKKNKKTLRLMIQGVIALTVALLGLQIIATVGFFALVAGASIAGMTGQMWLATAAIAGLRAGFVTLFTTILPVALVGLGLALVALSLTDIFDKSLQPAIFGIGVALSALGAAFLFPTKSIGLLKGALTAVPKALGALTLAASTANVGGFKILGANIANAFTGSMHRTAKTSIGTPSFAAGKGLLTMLKRNKLPVIGIAIAIGAAFALWLHNAVQKSPVFQGGLTTSWEEAGIQLKAAVGKTLRAVAGIFTKVGGFIVDVLKGLGSIGQQVFGALATFLTNVWANPGKAVEVFRKALGTIFNEDAFKLGIMELFDPDLEAINNLTSTFKTLREQIDKGTAKQELLSAEGIKKIITARLKLFSDANLTPQEIVAAVNKGFGEDILGKVLADIKAPTFGIGSDNLGGTNAPEVTGFEVLDTGLLAEAMVAAEVAMNTIVHEFATLEEALAAQALKNEAEGEENSLIRANAVKVGKQLNDSTKNNSKSLDEITKGAKAWSENLDENVILNKTNNKLIKDVSGAFERQTVGADINTMTTITDTDIILEKIDFEKLQNQLLLVH